MGPTPSFARGGFGIFGHRRVYGAQGSQSSSQNGSSPNSCIKPSVPPPPDPILQAAQQLQADCNQMNGQKAAVGLFTAGATLVAGVAGATGNVPVATAAAIGAGIGAATYGLYELAIWAECE